MVAEVGMGSWKRALGALQVFSHVEFISLQERPALLIVTVSSYSCQRCAVKRLGPLKCLASCVYSIGGPGSLIAALLRIHRCQ